MSFGWEAVAARSRGLATHLLDDDGLRRLGGIEERSALVELMGSTPYREAFRRPGDDPATLDMAVARSAAERLEVLGRWMRPREGLLAPVFLAFDARTLRGILRGILGGVPPDERITEAVPTPTLDRKAMHLLANVGSVGSLAATLSAWGHPLAPELADAAAEPGRPDTFALEAALGRGLGRAMRAAAGEGDDALRAYVSDEIDVWNVATALVLASTRPEVDLRTLFVEGGSAVPLDAFLTGAEAEGAARCAEILASATRGTLFESALSAAPISAAAVEERLLDTRITRAVEEIRVRPLSSIPVLAFLLRLRREGRAIRRAVWRTSLSTRRTP